MATEYGTEITLLRGVPLHPDYNDTVFFETAAQQELWFATFTAKKFTAQQYQRIGLNRIRLEGNAETYRNVNYCMIENSYYYAHNEVPKMYYAFVLSVEYINDNVFEVLYELDVMQTYHFNYTIPPCYVEREHAEFDEVGDNLVREPVQIGEYVVQDEYEANNTSLDSFSYILVDIPIQILPDGSGGGGGSSVTEALIGAARDDYGDPAAGDLSGNECSIYDWYNDTSNGGWDLLRPKSSAVASKLSYAMISLCNNNYIGYEYSPGSGGYTTLLSLGVAANWNPNNIHTNCVTNCSQAVYFCCKYAGIDPASVFTTANEYQVLMNTGAFDAYTDNNYTSQESNMRVGDILVTKQQAHTAIVVSVN